MLVQNLRRIRFAPLAPPVDPLPHQRLQRPRLDRTTHVASFVAIVLHYLPPHPSSFCLHPFPPPPPRAASAAALSSARCSRESPSPPRSPQTLAPHTAAPPPRASPAAAAQQCCRTAPETRPPRSASAIASADAAPADRRSRQSVPPTVHHSSAAVPDVPPSPPCSSPAASNTRLNRRASENRAASCRRQRTTPTPAAQSPASQTSTAVDATSDFARTAARAKHTCRTTPWPPPRFPPAPLAAVPERNAARSRRSSSHAVGRAHLR